MPGIGFIGAGIIIFQKHVVKGLTTAAGLWVTSAIGLTCGAGMFVLAAATTVMVLMCLEALHFVSSRFATRSILLTFSSDKQENIQVVLHKMRDAGIDIDSYEMQKNRSQGHRLSSVHGDQGEARAISDSHHAVHGEDGWCQHTEYRIRHVHLIIYIESFTH